MSVQNVKEQWGTRIGLVLAMAGNAVGLGNFLRFPVQAAQNGGGTFMIPYFISFILLGIPLMWIEWGVGRLGGRHGHGTVPGMFDVLTDRKKKWAKYLGILGVVMPLIVFIYYTYVASWMLGFSFFSITGKYFGLGDSLEARAEGVRGFLADYQNIEPSTGIGSLVPIIFFVLTMAFLGWILARGIRGGIEKLALYGVPLLFLFAIVLLIRILTLPEAAASPADGLNFIWNPQWEKLGDAGVWVAAAGQMFFTLSVGMGTIQTYASYLRRKDDVTLTGLSTAATNEFAEVVLGGTIAIPAAVIFFGVTGTREIAQNGSFDLGIVAMGTVLGEIGGSQLWGFLWFFLLFIAGVTSCVALASPTIAFLQEEVGLTRTRAAQAVTALGISLGMFHVVFFRWGVLDEWDYWAGTFGLVVFAAVEIFLFAWIFGINRGWDELHEGADLKIPGFYKPVMKWVTPAFLTVLLVWWGWTEAVPKLMMDGVPKENVPYLMAARVLMTLLLVVGVVLIRRSWQRKKLAGQEES